MKQLVKEKPDEPLDFLISKLQIPEPKRIFVVGPAGAGKKEKGLALAEEFKCTAVVVKDLLERELNANSPLSEAIRKAKESLNYSKSFSINCLVPDEIIIELVNGQLIELEKNSTDYMVVGYPSTRIQAIAMQKAGIVPDRIFILKTEEPVIRRRLLDMVEDNTKENPITESEAEKIVNNAVLEYNININDVKGMIPSMYCEIDGTQPQNMIVDDMRRIMKLRVKPSGPRSPPRIVVVGAPGSGKTTLSRMIAKHFSLVHVSTVNLLNSEVGKQSSLGKVAAEAMSKGELVGDDAITEAVLARLGEMDCKVNGWVLESFPKTEAQLNAILQLKQKPSLVVVLQAEDNVVFERHEYKKVDSVTGQSYSLKQSLDKEVLERLVANDSDKFEIVRKRLREWKAFLPKLEEGVKEHKLLLNADKSVKVLAESIYEAIENPID
eukprot:TRINITY_DN3730_c0_g1_i26.p1 TRINITY_DN3730_c0_g1~~TRINITY_DN3730_c0_g1_i26.p1  ORF type:complete len:438 (-),score=132.75 TRINITY_DN3730_c0_g1_i26:108-1421(-)